MCGARHLPLLVVRVAVAVVLGVCAVALDAAGALLNPGRGASPVVVLLVGFANPPGVRTSICEKGERRAETGLGMSQENGSLPPPSPGTALLSQRLNVTSSSSEK